MSGTYGIAAAWSLPIAHAGHWLLYILYAVPLLIVLGSILANSLRARRSQAPPDEPDSHSAAEGPDPPDTE